MLASIVLILLLILLRKKTKNLDENETVAEDATENSLSPSPIVDTEGSNEQQVQEALLHTSSSAQDRETEKLTPRASSSETQNYNSTDKGIPGDQSQVSDNVAPGTVYNSTTMDEVIGKHSTESSPVQNYTSLVHHTRDKESAYEPATVECTESSPVQRYTSLVHHTCDKESAYETATVELYT